MNIDWVSIWMKLFGTIEWFGVDIGFWISMIVCVLVVIIMNVVFWKMKPNK